MYFLIRIEGRIVKKAVYIASVIDMDGKKVFENVCRRKLKRKILVIKIKCTKKQRYKRYFYRLH